MKVVGVQIKTTDVFLVVLQKDDKGNIIQLDQSTKFGIKDHEDSSQIRQFRNQICATLDTIKPNRIIIISRPHRGRMISSPLSFKLEGLIQLYEKVPIEFIAQQTITAYFKKNKATIAPKQSQQKDAFEAAYMTIK